MSKLIEILNTASTIPEELDPVVRKLVRVKRVCPRIDGHFWVERDGEIIDPHFPEYDFIKSFHRGVKFVYHPADKNTQLMMTTIFFKKIMTQYDTIEEYVEDYIKVAGTTKRHNQCIINALIERNENGGQLVFGSWGIERADGSKFWEFGGDDWVGVKKFLK